MSSAFDVAVIGGGTAGLYAAQTATARGRRVALIERHRLGGECTWNGCVPSKALIAAARVAHTARAGELFGVDVDRVRVDFPKVMARVRAVVHSIASYEDADHLSAAGISVIRGDARFVAPTDLRVGDDRVSAERFVIATGSRPSLPNIPGLRDTPHLTSDNVFDLNVLPQHLVVVGGGAIGLELAQAFRRLGSDVTVIDALDRLLPREDQDVARCIRDALDGENITIRLGTTPLAAEGVAGSVRLTFETGAPVEGDALLVATGRRPRVESLGLDAAGVRVGRAGVAVDRRLVTSAPAVYAAGDVTGKYPFTHMAAYQGRIAGENAAGGRQRADYRVVPWVFFTDPEVAHVGLTELEARASHRGVEVATLPYTAVDRAVIEGQVGGMVKLVTSERPVVGRLGGGRVLGAHLVGPGAGELIHEVAVAMRSNSFAGRLAQTIHAYPSMSLAVQQAAAQLFPRYRAIAGDRRTDLVAP